jgi:hypothetical protein
VILDRVPAHALSALDVGCALALLLLLAATYKPRGMTRYGQRNQRRPRTRPPSQRVIGQS